MSAPLGLRPKTVWLAERLMEITYAIIRYREAGAVVPVEWFKEYNEIVAQLNKKGWATKQLFKPYNGEE